MVEDFTLPFLISAFVVVFIALFTIWAAWGLLPALGSSWAAERALDRAALRR